MGIRIGKEIGYFLSKDKLSQFIKDEYDDILDSNEDEDFEDKFFAGLEHFVRDESPKLPEDGSYRDVHFDVFSAQHLLDSYYNKKISIHKIIKSIYFYDDFEGLLFKTEPMAEASRYDDLIDYYEKTNLDCSIKYLNAPIYPISGYIYHGGLEHHPDIYPKLIKGNEYSETAHLARTLNRLLYNNELEINYAHEVAALMTKDGYFHPAIDSLIYFIAKFSGILKDGVTITQFNAALEPAILTTWG